MPSDEEEEEGERRRMERVRVMGRLGWESRARTTWRPVLT